MMVCIDYRRYATVRKAESLIRGSFPPRISKVLRMSQAPSSPPPPSSEQGNESAPPGNRRTTAVVVALAIALVAIPLLIVVLPVEIAHWHLAAASVKQKEGDVEGAEALLDKALDYAPDDASVHRFRCRILRDCELLEESLAAADRALELAPGDRMTQLERAQTLMDMARFSEAVRSIEATLDPDSELGNANLHELLNFLAYARSLAGEKLDLALEEINQALEYDPGDAAEKLDTRGVIHYQLGEHEQALEDLNQAVAGSDLREFEHTAEAVRQIESAESIETQREQARMSLAVMLYHRGLVYEAIDKQEQAESDYAKVRELGFEPNEGLY
jgi:tetratricopeptide (TPR) repeat protein